MAKILFTKVANVRQITTHSDLQHGRLSSRRTVKQKKRREETETVEKEKGLDETQFAR